MLKTIANAVGKSGRRDYHSLDQSMRAALKCTCIVLVLVFLAWFVFSGYYFARFDWVVIPVDNLWALAHRNMDLIKEVSGLAHLPLPAVVLGSLLLVFTLLVDAEKIHYTIDVATFRAVRKANLEVVEAFALAMRCPEHHACKIRRLSVGAADFSAFKKDVFYNGFANKANVGDFDQETMRARVFAEWTSYYKLNFIMLSLVFSAVWLLVCLLAGGFARLEIASAIALLVLLALYWVVRGARQVTSLKSLVTEQVQAWKMADDSFSERVARGRGFCPVDGCPTQ